MASRKVSHLKNRHLRFILLPECNVIAVVRPAPGLCQTEFLFINPAKTAVENLFCGIRGKPGLLARIKTVDVHIAIALKTNHGSVGGEFSCSRIAGHKLQCLVVE